MEKLREILRGRGRGNCDSVREKFLGEMIGSKNTSTILWSSIHNMST